MKYGRKIISASVANKLVKLEWLMHDSELGESYELTALASAIFDEENC